MLEKLKLLKTRYVILKESPFVSNFNILKKNFGIKFSMRLFVKYLVDSFSGFKTGLYQKEIVKYCANIFDDLCVDEYSTSQNLKINENEKIPVWVLWLQGEEAAPEVVKLCISSQKKFLTQDKFDYHLLTNDNLSNFITLNPVIDEKFKSGKITMTHLSDIIRAQLLYQYGGIWMDATLLMSSELPKEVYQYDFYSNHKNTSFSGQNQFVSKGRWTSYFLKAEPGNPLIKYLLDAFIIYWMQHDALIDYWLVDYALSSAYDSVPYLKKMIEDVPLNNQGIFELFSSRNLIYDEYLYDKIMKENFLHKLSYKEKCCKQSNGQLTFWGVICQKFSDI